MRNRSLIFTTGLAATALLLALGGGCDREEGRARPVKIVPMEYTDVPADTGASGGGAGATGGGGAPPGKGVIKGKLLYTGPKPALKTLGGPACHPGAPPVHEDWLLVNDKNELGNVVV